jgi:hypothetical protein
MVVMPNLFCVSMSSKAMLNVLCKVQNWVLPVILHMDCINNNEFPLVIIGVTDAAQQLHVLSVPIISYHKYPMYLRVVQGLKDIHSRLYPQVSLMPHYIMTDVGMAERKALLSFRTLSMSLESVQQRDAAFFCCLACSCMTHS